MELIEPLSDGQGEVAFRGFDMGPGRRGFATTVTGQGADATAPVGPSMILDPSARYQLDPTAPGMPMLPDVVSGPFAEPGLPAPDMRAMQSNISERVETLPGRGATQMVRSRYPGMTFNDRAVQSMVDYGDALPGETVADFQAKERQYNQALRDPFIGSTKENLSFEEMQQRVAMRGMMYGDDFRDRQARNQTQADLAARAARAPLGTPVLPPNAPGGLPMIPGMERNIERFLRTPEGAMFALKQGTEDARMQQRMEMTQPVPLGETGDFVVPLTGQVIQRQGDSRQMTPEEAQRLGLVAIESKNGVVTYGQRKVAGAPRTAVIKGVDHQWDAVRGGWVPATALSAEVGGAKTDPASTNVKPPSRFLPSAQ